MSHPAEIHSIPMPVGYVGNTTLYNPWGSVDSSYDQSWSYTPYGDGVYDFRAASVSNPPDEFGWRNPSAYSGSMDHATHNRCTVNGAVKNDATNWWPIVMRDAPVPAAENVNSAVSWSPTSELQYSARQKALLKFKDKKVDLSVAFAERRKTATLVVDSLRALTRLALDIKRLNGLGVAEDLSDLWLGYRYGWMPTVLDCYGAVAALEKADNGTYERYLVTARGKASLESDVTTAVNDYLSQVFSLPVVKRTRAIWKTEVKVRYDAYLTGSAYRRLQDVGVTDPLVTAWELVPYSFVADWFLGVGDFLDGLNALTGYTFRAGCETVYQSRDLSIDYDPRTSGAWRSETISGGFKRKTTRFTRSVLSTPTSQLLLKQEPLNLTRVFDSAALFMSALTGKSFR